MNRKFGYITGIALIVFNISLAVFKHKITYIPGIAGLVLLLTAFIVPQLLSPVRRVWDKTGEVLGMINTSVILSIMFFLIITPISVSLRLFSKRTNKMRMQKHLASYWQVPEHSDNISYKQQF